MVFQGFPTTSSATSNNQSHISEDAEGNHLVFTVWVILIINFSFVKYEIRRENCDRSYIGFINMALA